MYKFTFLTICFIVFSFICQGQHAVPLEYTVQNTDIIFEGKVVESKGYYANNRRYIYTKHKVQVFKIFKGESVGEFIDIITVGGNVDDKIQTWEHTPTCSVGDEGVFLCKIDQDNEFLDEQYLIPYGRAGVIEYTLTPNRYSAHDVTGNVFTNIYKDLYLPLKRLCLREVVSVHPNSIEQQFITKLSNDHRTTVTDVAIEFDFQNFSIIGISSIEFDILARSNVDDLKLGDTKVLLKYSPEAFGENVVSNGNVIITAEAILQASSITPIYEDYNENTIEITIPSDCNEIAPVPSNFALLTQSFDKLLKATIDIENIVELATLSLDDFNMQGNITYFDDVTKECIRVDTIIVPNEVKPFLIPVITGYFPNPITAGTDAVLTITGTGFGNDLGILQFSNADNGGLTLMTSHPNDTILWSDTLIQVRIPSRDNSSTGNPAGSGTIRVETSSGMVDDTTGLEIQYAVRNNRIVSSGVASWTYLSDDPIGDGMMDSILTFRVHQSVIDSSALAMGIIETAMCDWTTETGIQWDLGPTIPSGTNPDSINIINFTNNNSILGDATATTITTQRNCFSSGNPVFHNSEFNILLRADLSVLPNPSTGWYFDISGTPSGGQMDFYSVILHELGHAHNLKHAIPQSKVMYWTLEKDSIRRNFSAEDISGGNEILTSSNAALNMGNCPAAVSSGASCLTSLHSVPTVASNVFLYPNPTNGTISISLENYVGGNTIIALYNTLGQQVLNKSFGKLNAGDHVLYVESSILPKGIYYVTLIQKELYHIGKLVKN